MFVDALPLTQETAEVQAEEPTVVLAQVVAAPAEEVAEVPVVVAEVAKPPLAKSWPIWMWRALCASLSWLFGLASLVGVLGTLSVIPIVQFIGLGYLLEASARVARSGKLRDGFMDIAKYGQIGSLVVGTWLVLLPLRFLATVADDAYRIDPTGIAAGAWRLGQLIVTALALLHIALAWYSGGKLRHFFWPFVAPFQLASWILFGKVLGPLVRPLLAQISPAMVEDLYVPTPLTSWFPPAILWAGIWKGDLYTRARDHVWDFVTTFPIRHYFWLGLRGFAGAFIWLLIPSLMLIVGSTVSKPIGFLVGWTGAFGLAWVLTYLPFLQTHFAKENRFWAMFERKVVKQQFVRAPLAYWASLTVTLLFALPLYLLRIELIPRDLFWIPTVVFVLFIYPARLLAGWAYGMALRREKPTYFVLRLGAWLVTLPVVLMYLLILFFSQYVSWNGAASLLEQHAFLLPVPFVGL